MSVPARAAVDLPRPSDGLAGTDHDPDDRGYFGTMGGRWLPEALVGALDEVADYYRKARRDPDFLARLDDLAANYAGRPSPLSDAPRLTAEVGGARILLKREDLSHTGSHKINNVLGQALLAQRMGKTRLIAETGAGQHGVATATAAALLGLECCIYMGRVDTERQALNVAGCGCWAPRSSPSRPARPPSRTPSTRRSGTGWPPSTTPSTCSARWPARIRSR